MTRKEISPGLYDHTLAGDKPAAIELTMIAGRAMQAALDIMRPLLADTGAEMVGTFQMGTVKGDVHDIGKNLVDITLEGAGFKVVDLGVQVAPEKFVEAIREHEPDVVSFSAFLTTTMPMFKANIEAITSAVSRGRGDPGRRSARDTGVHRRGRRRRLRGRRRRRDKLAKELVSARRAMATVCGSSTGALVAAGRPLTRLAMTGV